MLPDALGFLVSFAVKSRSSALGDQFCSLFAEQSPRFAVKSRSNGVPFLSLTRPFIPHVGAYRQARSPSYMACTAVWSLRRPTRFSERHFAFKSWSNRAYICSGI